MAEAANGGGAVAYARSVVEANARNGIWIERQNAQTLQSLGPAPDDDEPDLRELREIPYQGFNEFDRKQDIRAVLYQLAMGQFYLAGQLGEAMLRDAKIYSALQTRVNGLLGLDLGIKPSMAGAKAKRIAALLNDDDMRPGLWRHIAPAAELSELLRWGLLLGVGIGEWSWEDMEVEGAGELWVPRLKIWHPSALYWQWDMQHRDSGYFRITTANGTMAITPGDGRWVLYTPFGFRRCWLRGLMRPLGDPYLDRRWAVRDFNRFNEVHGLPTRVIYVPADAPVPDRNRVRRQVQNLGSEGVLDLPVAGEGKASWDYKLVEAQAREWEGFKARIDGSNVEVEEVVLGQTQGTQTKSGIVAAKEAASEVRADYRRMDATTIPDCLHEQGLTLFTLYNWGDKKLAPRIEYDLEPDADEAKGAEVLNALATAIQTLATAAQTIQQLGEVPPPIQAILEAHGLPSFDVPEKRTPEALPPATAGDALEHAQETLSTDHLHVNLVAHRAAVKLSKAAVRRSRTYGDRLADASRDAAVDVLAPDLRRVMAIIRTSKDAADLKARLLVAFEGMSPAAMAKLVERSTILASLEGTHEITKGIARLPASLKSVQLDRGWSEEEHPRADDGKFGHGAGSHHEEPKTTPSASPSPHGGDDEDEAPADKYRGTYHQPKTTPTPRKEAPVAPSKHDPNPAEGKMKSVAGAKPGSQLPQHVQDRLKELGVSKLPAAHVSDVHVSDDLHAGSDVVHQHALIKWRDDKGRQQSSYSPEFDKRNAAEKFKRVLENRPKLEAAIPELRAKAQESPAHAAALLIAQTGLRPGSNESLKAENHYGVTTMEARHVTFDHDGAHIEYVGKEGVTNRAHVTDHATVEALRKNVEGKAPTDRVFKGVDNTKISSTLPAGVKVKDMRTTIATTQAEHHLAGITPTLTGDAKADARHVIGLLKGVSESVSKTLNNTPEMARKSYIAPQVIAAWGAKHAIPKEWL